MSNPQPTAESFRYRFLMGAMQQNALASMVRLACVPEEAARIDAIIYAWRGASARMAELAAREGGLPDRISVADAPGNIRARLKEIEEDRLFQASFSAMPTDFKIVELDYVDILRRRIPGKTVKELVEFCVGPRTEPPELKALQTAQNQMTYSSRSLDLRFISGAPKTISEDDIAVAHIGGQPVEALSLLVGFGAAPMN